jgi:hypothetical protein
VGTIMAYSSITMNASSSLNGRALAQVGAVTFNGSGGNLPLPTAPTFTAISLTPTNETVTLSTSPYFLLTLQTSTNLADWTTIATNTPATNVWMFTYSIIPKVARRFYQAFITPYP